MLGIGPWWPASQGEMAQCLPPARSSQAGDFVLRPEILSIEQPINPATKCPSTRKEGERDWEREWITYETFQGGAMGRGHECCELSSSTLHGFFLCFVRPRTSVADHNPVILSWETSLRWETAYWFSNVWNTPKMYEADGGSTIEKNIKCKKEKKKNHLKLRGWGHCFPGNNLSLKHIKSGYQGIACSIQCNQKYYSIFFYIIGQKLVLLVCHLNNTKVSWFMKMA